MKRPTSISSIRRSRQNCPVRVHCERTNKIAVHGIENYHGALLIGEPECRTILRQLRRTDGRRSRQPAAEPTDDLVCDEIKHVQLSTRIPEQPRAVGMDGDSASDASIPATLSGGESG